MNRRLFLQMISLAGVPVGVSTGKIQPDQYNPPHNSLQPLRLSRMPERIYAEEWKKRNVRKPWSNYGFSYIEWILCPDGVKGPPPVSERDAQVAASVIQWLGTNCGMAFVFECERKIKEEQEKDATKEKKSRM